MRGLATCVALFLLTASALPANDQSKKWIETGKAHLSAGRTADALLCFSNAVTCDKNDPDAVGWYGVALSMTSRTEKDRAEAASRLEEARAKGCKLAEVSLELGRTYLLQSRYDACLAALGDYERIHPGDWKASEWRGIALCRLGRHAEAIAALEAALKQGCPNKQMCEYYLGTCHEQLGQTAEARASFEEAYRAAPGSPFGLASRPPLGAPAKAWSAWQRAYGGFDTNPIALGNDTQIAPGHHRKEAWFGGLAAGGSYSIDLSNRFYVSLAAEGSRTLYSGVARANTDDVQVDVVPGWRMSDRVRAEVDLKYEHIEFGMEPFQDGFSVAPSLWIRETDWLRGEVEYRYTTSEVHPTFSAALDPDGHLHEVSVREHARVPGTELELDLRYEHLWQVTDGSEFDHEEDDVAFTASHPIAFGIVGTARVAYSSAHYDEPSVESLTGERRDDDIVTVQATLSRSFGDHWTIYLSGTVVDHESDVRFYDYDRNIWSLGVEHRF